MLVSGIGDKDVRRKQTAESAGCRGIVLLPAP
jgi:hypothetical protein